MWYDTESDCAPWDTHTGLVLTSILIWLTRVEFSSTESNMLHLGCIQVRKSKETKECKCSSCGAYLTHMSYILPSGVEWESRFGTGLTVHWSRQFTDIGGFGAFGHCIKSDSALQPSCRYNWSHCQITQKYLWRHPLKVLSSEFLERSIVGSNDPYGSTAGGSFFYIEFKRDTITRGE